MQLLQSTMYWLVDYEEPIQYFALYLNQICNMVLWDFNYVPDALKPGSVTFILYSRGINIKMSKRLAFVSLCQIIQNLKH